MKKLIVLLMIMFLLAGCSGKKSDNSLPAKPESTETMTSINDPLEKFYGTWRTSAIYTSNVRFDMEQIEALGEGKTFDMIFVINENGKLIAYSSYYDQFEEQEWIKGENNNSIIIGDLEFFIEDKELVMTVDEEKIYMAKISDRQDRNYLDELLKEENRQEESQTVEEPKPESEPEEESVSESVIRPEVKEAIDAYETFIDEYCEFMKKYSESDGTNLSILSDYMTFMSKLEDYSEKMDAMENDLTDAEYWYYIEVLNRCNEKMLKAAS